MFNSCIPEYPFITDSRSQVVIIFFSTSNWLFCFTFALFIAFPESVLGVLAVDALMVEVLGRCFELVQDLEHVLVYYLTRFYQR
jgi:hypothetical protein